MFQGGEQDGQKEAAFIKDIYLKRGGGEKIETEKSFIKRSSQTINVKKGYVATD